MEIKPANAIEIKKYFGYTGDGAAKSFADEWKKCTPADKAELADGVGREIAEGRFQA